MEICIVGAILWVSALVERKQLFFDFPQQDFKNEITIAEAAIF